MILAGFLIALVIFLAIGVASARQSRGSSEDYLIADKSVPAWLTGLSAVATNNSGYMFIGMIGYTYSSGLHTIWLMLGWIAGDLFANLIAMRRLRRAAARDDIHSFGGLLSNWYGQNHHFLRMLVGILTVFPLTLYAAAQLKAGGKAVDALLGWEPWWGVAGGGLLVLIYSWAGGIRASIWTDAAQSFVMLGGMLLLFFAGYHMASEAGPVLAQLQGVDAHYFHLFPEGPWWSSLLFILGWVGGGIAIFGQPHIVIRFMALDDEKHVNRMRLWYYTWFTGFYGATIAVALLARLLMPDTAAFDDEVALPMMAALLLPGLLVGLVLAALFAATMSTADSQILSCSAAETRDFSQSREHRLVVAKATTITVLLIAAGLAIRATDSVLNMVLDAWAVLGSGLAPLVIALALGARPRQAAAIIAVLVGIGMYYSWQVWWELGGHMYSVAPGMLAGALALLIEHLVQPRSAAPAASFTRSP